MTARTVVLVPRRAGNPWRDRLWSWCADRWARDFPDLELVEGHHDEGPFSRSAAVNRAAELAGDWSAAVIVDADTTLEAAQVRAAVARALDDGSTAVLAFDRYQALNRRGTERILDGYVGNWTPYVRLSSRTFVSSCLVVPRPLFDAVGGFDERFVGWGFEDRAFAIALGLHGSIARIPGDVWHLWHPRSPEKNQASPAYRANAALCAGYREARTVDELELVRPKEPRP